MVKIYKRNYYRDLSALKELTNFNNTFNDDVTSVAFNK